jgi:class 3 adenylate cyclase
VRRELPTGTVTLLFSDVEGSTTLLRELGAEAYADVLAEHRRIVRAACTAEGGVEVDNQGDAFFFAFRSAPAALGRSAGGDARFGRRPGLGTDRHAYGHAARHRGGVRRRRRPPRGAGRGVRARRPGRAVADDPRARRRSAAHRSRRASSEGHPGSRLHLPARQRALPAAEDDLEHQPPSSRELVHRQGA